VLNGADNDKEVFQTAVRMAAREKAAVRVELGPACSREMYEKHLDFVLWDVRDRLCLPPPEVTLQSRVEAFDLGVVETADDRVAPHRET